MVIWDSWENVLTFTLYLRFMLSLFCMPWNIHWDVLVCDSAYKFWPKDLQKEINLFLMFESSCVVIKDMSTLSTSSAQITETEKGFWNSNAFTVKGLISFKPDIKIYSPIRIFWLKRSKYMNTTSSKTSQKLRSISSVYVFNKAIYVWNEW